LFNAKKIVATAAIFGAGFAAFSTSSVVQAEPVSNSYAIVGSDTLEDVVNAIVNGTAITGSTVRVTINGSTLGSFDATGAPYIVTRPGGVRFSRPNGSGEGFQALSASIGDANVATNNLFTSGTYQNKGEASVSGSGGANMPASLKNININGQVDLSRSSSSDPKSSKQTAADATATIVRVPFARDAIAIVMAPTLANAVCAAEGQGTVADSSVTPAVPASGTCVPYLTPAQLGSLYETASANPTLTINSTVITFKPVIPQAGSGTRKDFLDKVVTGTKDDNKQTPAFLAAETAGYVATGQEHDAISAAFIAAGNAAIEPMSASRWIAMKNGASYDKSGSAVIGAVYTATTLGASPVTVTSGVYSPNSAYYADTTWGRDVFLFVERARIDNSFTAGGTITAGSKFDANLAALLDPTINNLANTQTTGASKVGKVKLAYGFLAPLSTDLAYFAPKYVGSK
jgi:ABC-type phosphate transport system substrate-binding protein